MTAKAKLKLIDKHAAAYAQYPQGKRTLNYRNQLVKLGLPYNYGLVTIQATINLIRVVIAAEKEK